LVQAEEAKQVQLPRAAEINYGKSVLYKELNHLAMG